MSTIFSELKKREFKIERPAKMNRLARREARWGLIFLSPWILGFLMWTLIPMVASLIFSFTDYNLLEPGQTKWLGLQNYIKMFKDPTIRTSMRVSLRFAAISLPIGILQPILMAALLNDERLRGRRFFTTLFYLPYIVPLVSAVYIWSGILNTQTGWVNMALEAIGIKGPDWMNSPQWIYPSLIIIGLWGAGNSMLFCLTAMQNIPTELYDAAKVDGAGKFAQFRHITIPMITPVIFYNLVLAAIGILQYFIIPYVLKGGSGEPGNTTMFYAMQLYKQAFAYSRMGYAATMAWVLFLATLIITAILFATSKYWVYYAAAEEN
jgi:multiple sugar transport system permease protein